MRCLISLSLLLALVAPAQAEDRRLTRAEQVELSDLVVTGEVTHRYARTERLPGREVTHHVVQVRVAGVEQGSGARRGQLLHARYWRVTSAGWKGEQGQAKPLEVGSAVRLFLSRADDGGWALLSPNGSEPATQPEVRRSTKALDALERRIAALLTSVRSGDKKGFAKQVNGLRLPDAGRWFARVFGADAAKRLTKEYEGWRPRLAPRLRKVLQRAIDQQAKMIVQRAEGWRAIGVQRRAAFAMRRKVRLYTVKFPQLNESLWNFAYAQGRLRWVGKLRALPSREPLVVKLEFSATTVDPTNLASHTLKLVIVNESTKAVDEVPTVYDGTTIALQGRGLDHLWVQRLKLDARPKQVYQPLKPNERRVVLETPLQDLFKPGPRANWSWDWRSHPVPPFTPIHRWRAAGFERGARFVVSVWAGRRTLYSKPVLLQLTGK